MPDEIATGQNTNNPAAAPADTGAAPAASSEAEAPAEAPADQTPQPAADGGEPAQDDDSGLISADDADDDGEAKDEEVEDDKPSVLGAPESGYTFEGYDPANAGVAAFSEAAKSLDLSQDSAKKLMDDTMAGMRAELTKQRKDLKQQALASKELGFNDPKVANRTNAVYGKYFGGAQNAGLRAKLRAYNLDVDPDFLGALKRIGADMSEGGFVQGKKSGARAATSYRAMFPNTKMNE